MSPVLLTPIRLLGILSATAVTASLLSFHSVGNPLATLRHSVPAAAQGDSKPILTAAAPIRFTDVAPRIRFDYLSNNSFAGRKYFAQPLCGGVAILDYDNDGHYDIFFSNGAKLPELKKTDATFSNCLLRNRGDGAFEDVAASAGLAGSNLDFCTGVAAADYDNDGFADLFVCGVSRNVLYHNNGNGTFADMSRESGLANRPSNLLSVGAAWFDYNDDGLLDLLVTEYTYWSPETDVRCQRDDLKDFYCPPKKYKSVANTLYRNLGEGKFVDVTEKSGIASSLGKGMGIGIADFNGDAALDIFVANDTEPNFLYLNQSNNTFKEVALSYGVALNDEGNTISGMGCDAKDFNNDGRVDIFFSDLRGQIFGLYRNNGGEFFESVAPATNVEHLSRPFSGWSNAFVDYDNDGWKDIYSANGDVDDFEPNAKQHDTMWRNLQGKSFVDVSESLGKEFLHLGFQRGSAVGDLNNDGFPDLVVTSLNEKPRVMLNSAKNGNHWLIVEMIGRRSNRDGIGASLTLTTESGRLLYNHVTTSVGFMSSSDRRVHFGLGSERTIKNLEIRWPSGAIQQLDNLPADQILKAEEPSGR